MPSSAMPRVDTDFPPSAVSFAFQDNHNPAIISYHPPVKYCAVLLGTAGMALQVMSPEAGSQICAGFGPIVDRGEKVYPRLPAPPTTQNYQANC